MAVYQYICDNCANTCEVTHGMDEVLDKCPHCESDKHIRKMPSLISIMKQKEAAREQAKNVEKPGEVVKSTIENVKKDVEVEREILKNRVWQPSEKK